MPENSVPERGTEEESLNKTALFNDLQRILIERSVEHHPNKDEALQWINSYAKPFRNMADSQPEDVLRGWDIDHAIAATEIAETLYKHQDSKEDSSFEELV